LYSTGPPSTAESSRVPSPVSQSFNYSPAFGTPSSLNQLAHPPHSPTSSSLSFSSQREMIVDDPGSESEGPESESEESDSDDSEVEETEQTIFAKAGFQVISLHHLPTLPAPRLLVCERCSLGVLPSAVLTHYKTHNVDLHLTKPTIVSVQKIIGAGKFLEGSNKVECPKPPCAPFDGLKIQDGYTCDHDRCNYCCVSSNSMRTHHSHSHTGGSGTAKDNYQGVQVQAFFSQHPKYFAVNPSLRGVNEDDLFAVYMKNYAPKIEAFNHFNPPLSLNEVPPLLKNMRWHEHLAEYTTDKMKVGQLLEIWNPPRRSAHGKDWMGKRLRSTIEGYVKNIQKKALKTPPGIKCLLVTCPRFVLFLY